MSGKGYIACAEFEGTIEHFGEGSTPEKAFSEFINGYFELYCADNQIKVGSYVDIKVFKVIYIDSPGANPEDFECGWSWILGDEVTEVQKRVLS